MSSEVTVHPLTEDPSAAWIVMKGSQKIAALKPLDPNTPIEPNKVRFVCMADTHSMTCRMPFSIPDGDVFLHAGDFTRCGHATEVQKFNSFLESLPHKHKIVIAGNHELSFDSTYNEESLSGVQTLGNPHSFVSQAVSANRSNPRDLLTNAKYLEDSEMSVYGIRIYGTPWQPAFCNWAFNLPRGQPCLNKWKNIPEGIDILLTHSPPIGHGDLCITGVRAGCVELLSTVQKRVHPKFHVFGHIHEGYGITTDGQTIFINASTCTIDYQPLNKPIVFDFPLPPGRTKE